MTQILRARRLLTEQGWLDDHQLRIEEGAITAIEPIPAGIMPRDAERLCPAYIDIHVHGGAGVDVMDDEPDALDKLAMHKAREGVASWLPTTVTAPLKQIHGALERIAERCHSGGPGAQVLGSYLEGPYFTPQNKGAHPPDLFRELERSELDKLIAISRHTLRVVALAPEKTGALQAIRHLKQQEIRVMLGHSAATWEQTRAAFNAGADGLVHCYNGMTGLHHREPGMVGAGLTDPRAWLELIADGHHVHPAAMKLCCCCAKDRVVLITDAMQAAGQPDGRYTLCGEAVEMRDGIVRTASGGLAGSTLSVDAAVRNMVKSTGIAPEDAIHMASLHPARLLGLDHQLGSLKVGKRANIIALSDGLQLQQIWIQGQALPL
ncbi:N-acetylglucosamine-6-phosphate deacetylase [Salmonella enterica subsp. salamae]|uniref:N-acetylglucosamine-6-phosphate deacetylase n=1 Tax=Salmonella enterica subsp. salamae TaxID=59202 RepID=A0A5Y3V1E3_SALER|nr:N-acetylglucosamine-6-phosphate deacetylase [Salmonella enterica subsp. salamae]EEO8343902.1 N-acetylglucosamine-6-phosphate deacetylase [Salmonella enterica]ECI3451546.1 N-acetylglucosamine-6-phosphate deacetylase [Salmonella enterica subsp. salamae]ECJ2326327.1 N-acetylglucosamine-6-phosphate deacetylase [Salmonella enterica subsp. salamae]EIC8292179.1 N-acetylglucosamine-6-phosphate deacetylase [Salmonella enterica]